MKKDIKAELIKMVTEKMATSQRLPWDSGLLNNVLMPVNAKTMKMNSNLLSLPMNSCRKKAVRKMSVAILPHLMFFEYLDSLSTRVFRS